mgnify:CR=1 FL=1
MVGDGWRWSEMVGDGMSLRAGEYLVQVGVRFSYRLGAGNSGWLAECAGKGWVGVCRQAPDVCAGTGWVCVQG